MKKNAIYYFSLAAILAGSVSSCREADLGFSAEEIAKAKVEKEFSRNFEERYGKIDRNHDWGFHDVPEDLSAGTRGTEVNRNEWTKIQSIYNCKYPGWPFDNQGDFYSGKYNSVNNGGNNPYIATGTNGNPLPAGDVTDEEIEYVSWWFRTHPNPGREPLHLTDFFLQEVSSDCDRDANGNAIKTANIYELRDGEYKITGTRNNEFKQNQLQAKTFASGNFDHVNNFNSGGSNWLGNNAQLPMNESGLDYSHASSFPNNTKYPVRLCQFYTSSGTEDFECHNSDKSAENNHWALVHLVFDINGRHYDGFYLGFDYDYYGEENKDGSGQITKYAKRDYDGYYSNWIVKIAPAQPIEEKTDRIMCEDLGNTHDFDFNDVVFDVTFNNTGNEALITLRASGGTLPIYVGNNTDSKYEAHYLMGEPNYKKPVNVNAPGGVTRPIANYRVTASSRNADAIAIYVVQETGGASATNVITIKPASEIKGTSLAPQKFCVPVTVRWMKETMQIETVYSDFDNWVQNATQYATWYNTIDQTNVGNLY